MKEKKQSQNRQAEGMVQGMMELQISEGGGINESGAGGGAFSSFNISTLLGRDGHQVGDQSPSLMEGKPVYDSLKMHQQVWGRRADPGKSSYIRVDSSH